MASLRFHDKTAQVREVHERLLFFAAERGGLRISGGDSWLLNSRAIRAEMERRGLNEWTVRFRDVEPDLGRFAAAFLSPLDRHPVTGGFDHWLNGLGRWDWWELGGRHDGFITGEEVGTGRRRVTLTSGPSDGRDLLERLEKELADAVDRTMPEPIDARADVNVEMVATLAERLKRGPDRLPGAIVLPPGDVPDEERWVGTWPSLGPTASVRLLTGREDANWRSTLAAAYARFADCWAAGVAFHQ